MNRAQLLLVIALPAALFPAACRHAAGTRASADDLEASMNSTLTVVGVLEPGEQVGSRSVPIGPASSLLLVVMSPTDLEVDFLLPDGTRVAADTANRDDHRVARVFLDEAPSPLVPGVGRGYHTLLLLGGGAPVGMYEVRVRAPARVRQRTPYTITALPASNVRLGLVLPQPEVLHGGALVIAALFFEGERPVARAQVNATIALESTNPTAVARAYAVQLRDDGKSPDAVARDGIFSALFVPDSTGRHFVAVTAHGVAVGMDVQRNTGGAFVVTQRTVELTGSYQFQGVDLDDNRRFDVLRTVIGIQVQQAGRYELIGVLRASNGYAIRAQRLVELDPGSQTVALDFSASAVRSLVTDGPYVLHLIRIDELTGSKRLMRETAREPARTRTFILAEFEERGSP